MGIAACARRFDLHMHSDRSDGMLPPDELLARCAAGGLEVVALTDHDLSATVDPGPRTVDGRTLHVVAGAEVSGLHDGQEYHLLVYFPGEVPGAFRDFCETRCRARATRYERAVSSLDLPGVDGPDAEARRGERALTRHHLARALVGAGHARSVRDAFRAHVDFRHGHVPPLELPFVDAIRIAREHGGVTSWAHPPQAAVQRHLGTFVEAGLQGLETHRPLVDGRSRRKLTRHARRHGLFTTGGSDWHGWTDARPGLFHVEKVDLRGFLDALAA